MIVVALEGVLPCQRHTQQVRCLDHLSEQAFRAAAPVVRVLAVAHLHTGEVQPAFVLAGEAHEVVVAAAVPRIVVARCQLGGVGGRLVPPVHAGQFGPKAGCRVKLHELVSILGHPRPGAYTLHARACDGSVCRRKHAVGVLNEQATVPREEEVPVGTVPVARLAVEEPRLPRLGVVVPGVVRPAQPPLWMPDCISSFLQVSQHVLVIALKLADAGKAPAPVSLRVGGVSELPSRAQPHGDLRYAVAE
mmetsp:Transcript_2175/g.6442  ORF Transcript_2175/g.6442 Transcript_2175/m.6442 type:complete len:248 (-) Transcript_2175:2188-2931(-)